MVIAYARRRAMRAPRPPTHRDLGALKARVKQLEDDKDRLAARADAARAAALALPGASVYASPCTALRREHDEEVAISERLAGAAAALDKARARTARASAAAERAAEVVGRGALAGGDGSALVEALKREVAALRVQVRQQAGPSWAASEAAVNPALEQSMRGMHWARARPSPALCWQHAAPLRPAVGQRLPLRCRRWTSGTRGTSRRASGGWRPWRKPSQSRCGGRAWQEGTPAAWSGEG